MEFPVNRLKRAVLEGKTQIGIWSSLASHISAEILAGSGFDWVLLDTEHTPNELTMVHQELQAMMTGTASPVVRPAWNDPVIIKRLLDVGVQNLIVPYVQTPEEARRAVASTRYPPDGIRGVAVNVRASRYGRVREYERSAGAEMCVIVQIETPTALDNLEAIAAVDGVDGLFIGPSDLAAGLGYLGQNRHPDVRAVIETAIGRIKATGKCPAILAPVEEDARHWLSVGARFVAVGSDLGLLARHSEALAARFKS
jgi:4-hydroxy-2-oxoheptanedioate aldolase